MRATNHEASDALCHQPTEPLEGARDANLRRHLDQHAALRPNKQLEQPGLVQGRVEQHQHRLVQDVRAVLARIAFVLEKEVVVVI